VARPPLEKIVVFGATSAIAQELVRLLAVRGAELVLVGRDPRRVAAVADDAVVRGARKAETIAADLDDHGRHAEILDRAVRTLGRIDLVLLAQGVLPDATRCRDDSTVAERALRTNFVAPALLLEAAAGRLIAQGSGTLAAISSVAGDRGRQSNYLYGSSKAGLTTFLQGLRNRLFPVGVHVLTVKPGFVDTPMTAEIPKNALFTAPGVVAAAILRAAERRRDVVYVPGFWRAVMWVIRSIPEKVFKRLKL
jgi:short-subunit dehydrogenase